MKISLKILLKVCFILCFCINFFACGQSDKLNIKSKMYPNIPNQILQEVTEVVTPEMFGAIGDGITDDTQAVQKCLAKYLNNKSVCALTKTYMCSSTFFKDKNNLLQGIRVYANTYVYLSGSLVASPKDSHGIGLQLFEYNGDNSDYKNKNITITGGGTIDGLGQLENTAKYCSLLRMGHGDNIKIENITFKNSARYHCVEISSCKNVVVNNCRFVGLYAHNLCGKKDEKNHSANSPHEFIQIEELDSGGSGGMTPYNTLLVPENITISNCTFSAGEGEFYKAIGDHGKRNNSYKNIKIINNTFTNSTLNAAYNTTTNPSNNCIVGFYTQVNGLLICGNTFENCKANAICASGDIEIKNNKFKNIYLGGISVLFNSEIIVENNNFEDISTINALSNQDNFSYIKIGNSQSAISVNVKIADNIFKNNNKTSVKILDCYEFSKSAYIYANNQEIGDFNRENILKHTKTN